MEPKSIIKMGARVIWASPRRVDSGTKLREVFKRCWLFALLADREWLDDATKTIGQFWKRKNAKRHGLATETQAASVDMLA